MTARKKVGGSPTVGSLFGGLVARNGHDWDTDRTFALALVLLLSDLEHVPLGCTALSRQVSDQNLRGKCGLPCSGFPNVLTRMQTYISASPWGNHKNCWQICLGFNTALWRLRPYKSESFIYGWHRATTHNIILNSYNHRHIRHWRILNTLGSGLRGTNAALLLTGGSAKLWVP